MPLNERIAQTLRAAIERGTHPVGSFLPSEAVLCTTFQASRFTIRETLRKLTEQGLIKDLHEGLQYARNTQFIISDVRPVQGDADAAGYVAADRGSIWLRIEGIRRDISGDPPISYVNVFVHPRFAPLLQDVRTAEGPIYALIEARSGESIGEAIQSISAIPMPSVAAKALDRQAGSPAMKFVRRYCDTAGATMLTSVNWHPGEKFSYTMRIQRGDWR